MVHCHDEVGPAKDEVAGLVKCTNDSEGLPLHQSIAGLGTGGESTPHQGDLPAGLAAKGVGGGACTVFLEQPKTDSIFAPVSGEAGWLGLVEDHHPFMDLADNKGLRFLKEEVQLVSPQEGGARLEEFAEGQHAVSHGEGIGDLYCEGWGNSGSPQGSGGRGARRLG